MGVALWEPHPPSKAADLRRTQRTGAGPHSSESICAPADWTASGGPSDCVGKRAVLNITRDDLVGIHDAVVLGEKVEEILELAAPFKRELVRNELPLRSIIEGIALG